MKKVCYFFLHTGVNTLLLALFLLTLTAPFAFSLKFLTSREILSPSFRLAPSSSYYRGYLSFEDVAGGGAEKITVHYTAFPDFESFYEGIYTVKNTQIFSQLFILNWPKEENVRLFFGKPGEISGPSQIVLGSGEKATINLAAGRAGGEGVETKTLTFTLQSFPQK